MNILCALCLPSIAAGCVGYCRMLLVYRTGELTTVVHVVVSLIDHFLHVLETVESKQCLVHSIKHRSTIAYQ